MLKSGFQAFVFFATHFNDLTTTLTPLPGVVAWVGVNKRSWLIAIEGYIFVSRSVMKCQIRASENPLSATAKIWDPPNFGLVSFIKLLKVLANRNITVSNTLI